MRPVYLIRYGVARSIAPFAAEIAGEPLERGQAVVVRTHRGTELGEILGEAPATMVAEAPPERVAPLLRVASDGDILRAELAAGQRSAHFEACQTVFREGIWPLELIDAEPLLDEGRTVLHYLGPHRLDAAGLVAIFRDRCGLDIVLEPVGLDIDEDLLANGPEEENADHSDDHGCGSCGSKSGGCGSCGSAGAGCAVKALVKSRQKQRI